MSGTKAQQAREMMAGVCPARAEQRKPPGATSAAAGRSLTGTSLGVPSTAGSLQRRPNARCAAVGEASEASRGTYLAVAHAYARRHGCLSPQCAEGTDARQMPTGMRTLNIALPKVVFRAISLIIKNRHNWLYCHVFCGSFQGGNSYVFGLSALSQANDFFRAKSTSRKSKTPNNLKKPDQFTSLKNRFYEEICHRWFGIQHSSQTGTQSKS